MGADDYQIIFNLMNESICIIDMIFDGNGYPVDYRILETNVEFKIQNNLPDADGKLVSELVPNTESYWFEMLGKVATTGNAIRYVNEAKELKRWFDVYAFKLGGAESNKVAVFAYDITDLKQKEEKLDLQADLLSSVHEAIIASDESDLITYWNRMAEQIFGWPAAEVVGKTWTRQFAEMNLFPPPKELAGEFFQGNCYIGEVTGRRKNGSQFIGAIHSKVLRDELGRLKGTITSCRDITQKKEQEIALYESEEKFRKIVASAYEGITIIDEQGIVQYANDAMANYLRCSVQEMIGKPIFEFYFQEDVSKAMERLEARKANISEKFDFRLKRIDGEAIWFSISGTTILDEKGKFRGNMALYMDITDRVRKEEELQAVKESLAAEVKVLKMLHALSSRFIRKDNLQSLYDEIIRAAIDLTGADSGHIAILDPHNNFRFLAQQGLSEAVVDYFENIDVRNEWTVVATAINDLRRVICEEAALDPHFKGTSTRKILMDHSIHTMQSTPLISASGNVLGTLTTNYAISHPFSERELRMLDLLARQAADAIERKKAEETILHSEKRARALVEELRKADERKNEFLNVLSHELRNPLASIMMSHSLLDRVTPGSLEYRKAQEVMNRQTAQLAHLVDDLLDMTRITQNKIILKNESIDLGKLLGKAITDYQGQFASKGVTLESVIPETPLMVKGDPVRLTQVMGNLLHNSAKFTDQGGFTRVSLRRDEETKAAIIEVLDNGIGIDPEKVQDLFLPFHQVDKSLDRSHGGLGLGLAIVKGIVELHQGFVTAFSRGIGQGTQVTIRLPELEINQSSVMPRSNPAPSERKLRIMVIDDIQDVAEILCALLQVLGHEAVSAHDGLGGLEKARAYDPQVILCDIGLPGMNGYEVAQTIRSDQALHEIYLIALSGYAQPHNIEQAKQAGFNQFLAKPVDLAALEKALAEVD